MVAADPAVETGVSPPCSAATGDVLSGAGGGVLRKTSAVRRAEEQSGSEGARAEGMAWTELQHRWRSEEGVKQAGQRWTCPSEVVLLGPWCVPAATASLSAPAWAHGLPPVSYLELSLRLPLGLHRHLGG